MVNPNKITNYKLSRYHLEETILFWICVAGKTAASIAPRLDGILKSLHVGFGMSHYRPFEVIRKLGEENLRAWLKNRGIGCYNLKAKGMYAIAISGIDLKKCSVEELDAIPGIGLKTASCFVMHSRANARCAGLDTHLLKFLADLGHNVPKATPGSKKQYQATEKIFLEVADRMGRTSADMDLLIWRVYSKHPNLKPRLLQAVGRKIPLQ